MISPLLANLYMNRFLKHWRMRECGAEFRAHLVNYADDFVILSRGHAAEALAWTRAAMTKLELTLNEAKTSLSRSRPDRLRSARGGSGNYFVQTFRRRMAQGLLARRRIGLVFPKPPGRRDRRSNPQRLGICLRPLETLGFSQPLMYPLHAIHGPDYSRVIIARF